MDFIIKRKVLISMLFVALTLLGVVSYKNLSVELYPDTELPMLFVQIAGQTESDPKYVEQEAIIPMEGVVGTLEGIEKVESRVGPGRGTIIIYLTKDVDFKYAYLKLAEKVQASQSLLPDNYVATVLKMDLNEFTNQFMSIQVLGTGGVDRVRAITDEKIVDKLENIDGVAGVEVYGGREKSVEIELNEDRIEALGLTVSQIRSKILSNTGSKTFAGRVVDQGQYLFVNVDGEYNTIRDIENVVISNEGPLLLKDIAQINFGYKDVTSYSRVNSKESVTLTVTREASVNQINLSAKIKEQIETLNQQLAPEGVEVAITSNSADTMEENIDQIIDLALIGSILAVFILWIFLKNIPLVSLVMLSIPISVFSAFNLFYAFDISINTLTLIGIALAVGMLIDNSIVVMENIYRVATMEDDKDKAVIMGTKEVWRAILAATLTTITVFLPFVFSSNAMFKLVAKNISVSIVGTLIVSLVVALLLIPMMTHAVLSYRKKNVQLRLQRLPLHNRLIQAYLVLLKNALRLPARTINTAVFGFFLTILISLVVSYSVNKEVETPEFVINIERPSGSTLEGTDFIVQEFEKRLENIAEKDKLVSQVYEEKASLTVQLKEDYKKDSNRSLGEIKAEIQSKLYGFEDSEIVLEQGSTGQSGGGGGGAGFGANPGMNLMGMFGIGQQNESVVIKGENFDKMLLLAEDIKYILEDNIEDLNYVRVSASSARPEVHLEFNPGLMSMYGVTPQNVLSELSVFQNEVSSGGVLKIDNDEYDIVIKTNTPEKDEEENTAKTYDDLKELNVQSNTGNLVALNDFSDIIYASGRSEILRVNQQKEITITYAFSEDVNDSKDLLEQARSDVDDLVAAVNLPAGTAIEVIHEEDQFEEFKFLIGTAFLLILMILASVFESFVTPFVMLFSIPLAAIGSFLGLIFTGNSLFNMNSLIGFLILLGIVVNNGIILIDYSNILRKQGMRHSRALLQAGISRVRPILITASTTIIAMLPLALGKSEYVGSLGAPFAITVVGGLLVSTLLTLVFIPTFSFGLENALKWIRSLNWIYKIIIYTLWALGIVLIQVVFDHSLVWKLVEYFGFIVGIPAIMYFVLYSLRRASASLISEDEKITIKLQNVVKVYDRDNRFIREWKMAKEYGLRERGLKTSKSYFEGLIWQIPLFGFLIWMNWFYLESGLWAFVYLFVGYFSLLSYIAYLRSWPGLNTFFTRLFAKRGILEKIVLWFYPVLVMGLFAYKFDSLATSIVLGGIWYLGLFIYNTGNRLLSENINVERLKGRFAGIRRSWYLMVRSIPVIGSRKQPFKAVKGLSLTMHSGMIGLLGPNGAGKTTIMRIICGILDQSYGKIFVNGYDTNKYREELQGLIGYLPQEFGSYDNMTSFEFLDYMALLKGLKNTEERYQRVEYVLKAVHMWEKKDKEIGSFSGGMKQRIGIAQIMLHLPRILVVDEPTAGLDPRERIRFRNLLVELSRDRIVIFSTHIIEDISSSCNQVAVMRKGELKYWGEPKELSKVTQGKVWVFDVPASDFKRINKEYQVVHHIGRGDMITVRVLSQEQPVPEAQSVSSSLEDSYLWLLRNN
ncbi:efflux RND transporter permease subunit [Plebeiibacterium sediminum]|uniref:Efflux RND transporter permease subunit n=1 Tax=Plebeiibacterium sediminum TaxID=2992112 RepID=A0AAE3SGS4_9BACT|nr:efflux RND transporter permease subunit [Plebeiobacterium sediminum]MCW3788641.1 efflux RND transporter permease subunit [Plebeiobacterium sediminum]